MDTLKAIKEKYELLSGILDERGRRIWAAVEARCHPHGGITLVSKATGLSRTTVDAGRTDLAKGKWDVWLYHLKLAWPAAGED